MTAYMFPPHLLRTGYLSRTLAQPRLKRTSTPEPLPSVALFPYRTTKSRHWVLYAVIRPDASSNTKRVLLFKRSGVPVVRSTGPQSTSERRLWDPSKTANSLRRLSRTWLFSAVALAADLEFANMRHDAEGAVNLRCSNALKNFWLKVFAVVPRTCAC